jgi:hypothetical protein
MPMFKISRDKKKVVIASNCFFKKRPIFHISHFLTKMKQQNKGIRPNLPQAFPLVLL